MNKWSRELLHFGKMVCIDASLFIFLRLEQKISCEQLVHDASEGPNVSCFIVIVSKDDLWRSILPGLNQSGEVMVLP